MAEWQINHQRGIHYFKKVFSILHIILCFIINMYVFLQVAREHCPSSIFFGGYCFHLKTYTLTSSKNQLHPFSDVKFLEIEVFFFPKKWSQYENQAWHGF